MGVAWRLTVLLVLAAATGVRARTQPSFDEIVAHLSAAAPGLHSFIVDQHIDLRVLGIFRWRLRATVYAERPARYRVVLHDPPAVLRRLGTVFADAASPERVLADYRAVSVVAEDRILVAELEGRRSGQNPPRMRVSVDGNRWLVTETLLRYGWGTVQAQYAYDEFDGYTLPSKIRVSIPVFALGAVVTFVDYRLNVPLPEGHAVRSD